MKIIIEDIPHKRQRYDTAGDWFYTGKGKKRTLHIKVSATKKPEFAKLVAIHELVEVMLCERDGVSQREVDAFDFAFKPSEVNDEPGDDPNAPYQRQHNFATAVERMLCAAMGLKWDDYAEAIESL